MDFGLTTEQKLLQETLRDFARRELLPNYASRDADEDLPPTLMKKLDQTLAFLRCNMDKVGIGKERIYNAEFAKRGIQSVVKWDILPVLNNEVVSIVFEEINSRWRQGIRLKTDRGLEVDARMCPSVVLWYDTAPKEVFCRCLTSDGCLSVYNIWDKGDGRDSQAWSSGMVIEELLNGRRYRCNDIGFDTRFDKLVVRIERKPTLS